MFWEIDQINEYASKNNVCIFLQDGQIRPRPGSKYLSGSFSNNVLNKEVRKLVKDVKRKKISF